jgi:hypothetical protein
MADSDRDVQELEGFGLAECAVCIQRGTCRPVKLDEIVTVGRRHLQLQKNWVGGRFLQIGARGNAEPLSYDNRGKAVVLH